MDETGPIDYLVVEFPGSRMTGEGLPVLVDLVDAGIIRILDLSSSTATLDGSITAWRSPTSTTTAQLDLAVFEGASSGLLGQDDVDEAASVIEPGNSAGILVYENVWAAPFAAALRRGGAQLVASGRIPVQAILAADARAAKIDARPTAAADRRPEPHHPPNRSERLIPCQVCFAGSPAPPSSREPPPPSPDASNAANRDGGPTGTNKPPPNKPHHRSPYAEPSTPNLAAAPSMDDKLAQLKQLGELRDAGCSPTPSSKPRRAKSFTPPGQAATSRRRGRAGGRG